MQAQSALPAPPTQWVTFINLLGTARKMLVTLSILGLIATNIATLMSDAFHGLAFDALSRMLYSMLPDKASDLLRRSPTVVRKTDVARRTTVLEADKSQLARQVSHLEQDRNKLKGENETLSENSRKLKADHDDLNSKHQTLSSEHDGLKSKHQKLTTFEPASGTSSKRCCCQKVIQSCSTKGNPHCHTRSLQPPCKGRTVSRCRSGRRNDLMGHQGHVRHTARYQRDE